jgi:hypothetical protein
MLAFRFSGEFCLMLVEEDFLRRRRHRNNESAAMYGIDARRIAIFTVGSTRAWWMPIHCFQAQLWPNALAEAAGMIDMRHFNSLLRSTRARIGRRLAQIVAIAAASLPAAGV